jgi:hypothetical protein
MHILRPALPTVALLVLCLALVGCESKISYENYQKITQGMSRSAVDKLLGTSGDDETASGTSITGAGIAEDRGAKLQVIRYKETATKYIVVTYKDGKVVTAVQGGLE